MTRFLPIHKITGVVNVKKARSIFSTRNSLLSTTTGIETMFNLLSRINNVFVSSNLTETKVGPLLTPTRMMSGAPAVKKLTVY